MTEWEVREISVHEKELMFIIGFADEGGHMPQNVVGLKEVRQLARTKDLSPMTIMYGIPPTT